MCKRGLAKILVCLIFIPSRLHIYIPLGFTMNYEYTQPHSHYAAAACMARFSCAACFLSRFASTAAARLARNAAKDSYGTPPPVVNSRLT
jgi:hypothetical protein